MSLPEKVIYMPPGAAPAQIPGQYPSYQQGQPPQYQNQQYPQTPSPQYQQSQPQYQQSQPQYQQLQSQYQQPQPQPQYGQQPYPQGQYQQYSPLQPPQNVYSQQPQPQFQSPPQPYPAAQPYATVVMQQPLPVIGMTVASGGGNRNVKNLALNAQGRREWSFGLCDCFDDCGTCMLGCCCPCMLYAQVKQRLDYLNTYARPDPTHGGSGVDINCLAWGLLHCTTGCGFILQTINRGHMRNRYMIDGNGCSDFGSALCCTPCELTQEHRELELEEQSLMK
ncbi:hypothetical protein AX15_002715 [Amanita polypyramis BW_CC]|nr:hypothetical protein AX15_002715 [Amanita polypyramis BW_CC]